MAIDYVYKIRRKSDGAFSKGGSTPAWNKTGKAWTTIGKLKNHLSLFCDYDGKVRRWPYKDCEIVRYAIEISEMLELTHTLQQILVDYSKDRKHK